MPPRKRAKASAASTPLAETQPKTPQETGPLTQSSPHNENAHNDPWSDDQETQLFKNMMKWKPTGLHKHFRMMSIHMNMHSHGYVTDDAPHTRIAGVWRKLDQLYDLRALDERENAYAFSDQPDPTDPTEAYDIPSFDLPEEDFGELMWQRRFRDPNSEGSASPPSISIEEDRALYRPGIGLLRDFPESVRSQKADSASGATPTPKIPKATRSSRSAAKGKAAKASQNVKNTKAQAAESESAEEEVEEGEDEDGEEEEESSSESAEEPAPSTRRTNRSSGRAKPAPKRATRKKN